MFSSGGSSEFSAHLEKMKFKSSGYRKKAQNSTKTPGLQVFNVVESEMVSKSINRQKRNQREAVNADGQRHQYQRRTLEDKQKRNQRKVVDADGQRHQYQHRTLEDRQKINQYQHRMLEDFMPKRMRSESVSAPIPKMLETSIPLTTSSDPNSGWVSQVSGLPGPTCSPGQNHSILAVA